MPKALFFNVPGHGHVIPSLPLVAELARRGHEVAYYVSEGFRAAVEAAGATFRPYRTVADDYFDARGLHGGRPQKVALALFTTAQDILPDLLAEADSNPPDYILFDSMCPWGYLAAQALKVPKVASMALSPPVAPPPSALLRLLPLVAPMLLRDFSAGVKANRLARTLADRYGAPPPTPATLLVSLGDLSISYTSSYFQPFAATVPASVHLVGWTMWEPPGGEAFSFEQAQGRPLVYISLGTLNNHDRTFFQTCIEAFRDVDAFVIISTGKRIAPESFGALPANIAIHAWVPQSQVLKQAALFISHGGLNSIHDGLSLGLPLLLIPQQEEQTLNAMRVVELGAGLMLKRAQVGAERLRADAMHLLAEPRFKIEAQRIGETLRTAGGVARAADAIEALLVRRPS